MHHFFQGLLIYKLWTRTTSKIHFLSVIVARSVCCLYSTQLGIKSYLKRAKKINENKCGHILFRATKSHIIPNCICIYKYMSLKQPTQLLFSYSARNVTNASQSTDITLDQFLYIKEICFTQTFVSRQHGVKRFVIQSTRLFYTNIFSSNMYSGCLSLLKAIKKFLWAIKCSPFLNRHKWQHYTQQQCYYFNYFRSNTNNHLILASLLLKRWNDKIFSLYP